MQKLSVIITTYNEAQHIGEALESVNWADEIIVVDSFSTDQTPDIARRYSATVLQREYIRPAEQKNWIIPQAAHEWILLLDADERVPAGLAQEIKSWLKSSELDHYDAFWIGRINHFMGQKIRYSGWQGDAVVRFFRRDRCRYEDKNVHEEIITEGIRVGRLKNKMLHFTFKDHSHFLQKVERYAAWSAQDHQEKTRRVTYYHLMVKPRFRFFKHFVLKRGFLDGRVGFIISVLMAWSVFLRYVRLMELQTTRDNSGNKQ